MEIEDALLLSKMLMKLNLHIFIFSGKSIDENKKKVKIQLHRNTTKMINFRSFYK